MKLGKYQQTLRRYHVHVTLQSAFYASKISDLHQHLEGTCYYHHPQDTNENTESHREEMWVKLGGSISRDHNFFLRESSHWHDTVSGTSILYSWFHLILTPFSWVSNYDHLTGSEWLVC